MIIIEWNYNECTCTCSKCGNTDKEKMICIGKLLLCRECDDIGS
jgi:hypothetical protein